MLADRVKAERERRGWSQRDLAAHSSLGQSYISQLESRRRSNPTQEVLQKLARAFDLTVTDLLEEVHPNPAEFPSEQLRLEGLPDYEIERIWQLWNRFPDKHNSLLDSAHRLAHEHAQLNQLTKSEKKSRDSHK